MNLTLYDADLTVLSRIGNNFASCLWSEGYNSAQPFTLELFDAPEYRKKVKPDCYIGRSDRKTMMVIKTVQIVDKTIVITGKQATRILDDVAFIGTIEANSIIDTAIITAYNRSNRFPHLTFKTSNLGIRYKEQISNKSFLELCETICQDTDIGLRVVRNGQALNAELYQPSAKQNVKLAESLGNVKIESVILSTENYKNYAIVLGEGEDEARTKVTVDMTGGDIRREMVVDARDLQTEEGETAASYTRRLQARGVEKLLEQQKTWECACIPRAEEFGKKFDLGDIITVALIDFGLKFKTRITRFTEKEQLNQTETTIEVGNITIV